MNWIIIILSIALLLWLLYQEWSRANKNWLAGRIVANIVAVASLLFIALPIRYRSKISFNKNEAVLLTEGWNKDSVNRFLRLHKGVSVFTTEQGSSFAGAAYVPDLHLLNQQPFALHVFGFGLNEYELRANKKPYKFYPADLQNTIREIGWNQSVPLGRPLQVQGSYSNYSGRAVKIILSAFSIPLDSVTIPSQQTASFQLSTVPLQIGRAVFTLSVLQGKDTIESNPVPVEVTAPQPLRLLLLSSGPDFEKKFLKNWLSQEGFSLAIKTKLTVGKWDHEFINRSPGSRGPLTTSMLREFEIVLADVNALDALSAAEASALLTSVGTAGTGLLVQMDSAVHTPAFYSKPFMLTGSHDSVAHNLQLRISTQSTILPLTAEAPFFIKQNEGLQTNLRDQQNRILAATALYGAGRVLATTVNNSFVWQLSGQGHRYNLYWQYLLTSVAPKSIQNQSWQLNTALPRKDEPLKIRFRSNSTAPSFQVGETALYPAQDYFLTDEWNTTYWPRRQGWHAVMENAEGRAWLYVYDHNDWTGVKNAERIRQTILGANNSVSATTSPAGEVSETKEVAPYYFFLLFVASAGFLWFEKKRHRS